MTVTRLGENQWVGDRSCGFCRATIDRSRSPKALYCTNRCQRSAGYARSVARASGTRRVVRQCATCRGMFALRASSRADAIRSRRVICYDCSPTAGQSLPCPACLKPFVTRKTNQQFCSALCHQRFTQLWRIAIAECSVCRNLTTVHGKKLSRYTEYGTTQCSPECRKVVRNQASHDSWVRNYENAKRHARKGRALRRARLAGLPTEVFTHEQVFERDKWICHICKQRIDQRLDWPDPGSAALDHVIPVSKGGPHTLANVAASHSRCNGARGNRGGLEQLRLIG